MFFRNDAAHSRLVGYLSDAGITPEELMVQTSGDFLIFGGAVRDALAGEKSCNDIDMIVKENTAKKVWEGFKIIREKDDYKLANHIRITKAISNRLHPYIDLLYKNGVCTLMTMLNVVANVDINVNGIAWHPFGNFMEVIPNSVKFCERKVFYVSKKSHGYDAVKIDERKNKLISNGWLEVIIQ